MMESMKLVQSQMSELIHCHGKGTILSIVEQDHVIVIRLIDTSSSYYQKQHISLTKTDRRLEKSFPSTM